MRICTFVQDTAHTALKLVHQQPKLHVMLVALSIILGASAGFGLHTLSQSYSWSVPIVGGTIALSVGLGGGVSLITIGLGHGLMHCCCNKEVPATVEFDIDAQDTFFEAINKFYLQSRKGLSVQNRVFEANASLSNQEIETFTTKFVEVHCEMQDADFQEMFEDAVSFETMKDPYVLLCGHRWDKKTLEDIYDRTNKTKVTCPSCQTEHESTAFKDIAKPDKIVPKVLEKWKRYQKKYPSGS